MDVEAHSLEPVASLSTAAYLFHNGQTGVAFALSLSSCDRRCLARPLMILSDGQPIPLSLSLLYNGFPSDTPSSLMSSIAVVLI